MMGDNMMDNPETSTSEYDRGVIDAYKQFSKIQLESMERAFKAGRAHTSYSMGCSNTYVYETFNDYINQKGDVTR